MSAAKSLQITIDDRPLKVEKGITILQAARQNGMYIPTLCDYPGLPAHGSCRMWLHTSVINVSVLGAVVLPLFSELPPQPAHTESTTPNAMSFLMREL